MAVAAGFEPAVGGYPTNAFEAFTFGRSDTPPPIRIEQTAVCIQIWGGQDGARVRGEPDGRPGWLGESAKCKANVRFLQIADQNRPQTDHYLQKSHRTRGWEPNPSISAAVGTHLRPPHHTPKPAVASGRRQAQKTARRGQYTMHHTRTGGNPAPKTNGA